MILEEILEQVREERVRQDDKWGPVPRNLSPERWLAILAEEFGEFAHDVCDHKFEYGEYKENMRDELIQIAAVAVVIIEDLDHQEAELDRW